MEQSILELKNNIDKGKFIALKATEEALAREEKVSFKEIRKQILKNN
jgi:hypothetical protein